MRRHNSRQKNVGDVVLGMALLALGAGCSRMVVVKGQAAPPYRLKPRAEDFRVPTDVVAMHYYGSGGWGISWRGQFLLFAPYFSNHSVVALRAGQRLAPKLEAIRAGVAETPITSTSLLLIGHGHVDHAGDVGSLFSTHALQAGQVGLIADRSTVNILGAYWNQFKCHHAIDVAEGGRPISDCVPAAFRIIPIHSSHAPHLRAFGVDFEMFGGVEKRKRELEPSHPADFKLGYPWAFVVDLLDAGGVTQFRIHYMDAAGAPPHGLIPGMKFADRDIDIHIGCVPGFNYVTEYPDEVLRWGQVRYVMAAHWEDFFRPTTDKLAPVNVILDNDKLDQFVDKIEASLGPTARGVSPIGGDRCTPDTCGPRGGNWALPIPGETFQFHTGPQARAALVRDSDEPPPPVAAAAQPPGIAAPTVNAPPPPTSPPP